MVKLRRPRADQDVMEARPTNLNEQIATAVAHETRETLARWSRRPFRTIVAWLVPALAIASAMLVAVLIVSKSVQADLTSALPVIGRASHPADVARVFGRNSLVLALHAFVCIAGFMAMRTLPEQAMHRRGVDRWVHQHAGPFAMVWVTVATIFSITTQTWVLGQHMADIAFTLGISQGTLLLTLLPHALPELTAVFLPLAAFLIASRRGDWHELLAATIVTVAVAIPILIAAAFVEAYAWPTILRNTLT